MRATNGVEGIGDLTSGLPLEAVCKAINFRLSVNCENLIERFDIHNVTIRLLGNWYFICPLPRFGVV